jgi:ankyrin repeat protein
LYCLQIVQLLVDAGANIEATVVLQHSNTGQTVSSAPPLALAAAAGQLDIMQILLGEWQIKHGWLYLQSHFVLSN